MDFELYSDSPFEATFYSRTYRLKVCDLTTEDTEKDLPFVKGEAFCVPGLSSPFVKGGREGDLRYQINGDQAGQFGECDQLIHWQVFVCHVEGHIVTGTPCH